VQDPRATATWLEQFGSERVVLALDVRNEAGAWRLAVQGWTRDAGVELDVLADFYTRAGARHLLCTDIGRDGTLGGFNLALYRELRERRTDFAIQASGGACSLDDVRRVRAAGTQAVILGRALLEGRFTLREALEC